MDDNSANAGAASAAKRIKATTSQVASAREDSAGDDAVVGLLDGVATVTLNRPKALNTISLAMASALKPLYAQWNADTEESVTLVVMKGEGRAFCAGGDVKTVALDGLAGGSLPRTFFKVEYELMHLIATSPIPQVALLDGFTMGGGVGLALHGQFQVATENTLFSMPETGIGLFPDVGGTFLLSRIAAPGVGLFLALTGTRLRAAELRALGLVSHALPSGALPELEAALRRGCCKVHGRGRDGGESARAVLDDFVRRQPLPVGAAAAEESPVLRHLDAIARCFGDSQPDVGSVLRALREEEAAAAAGAVDDSGGGGSGGSGSGGGGGGGGDPWAAGVLDTLQKMSPTSLKVTLEAMRRVRGGRMGAGAVLQMEYRMVQRCMATDPRHDFYEGIRAALVDKDRQPKWSPPSLEAVTAEDVASHFEALGPGELELPDAHPHSV